MAAQPVVQILGAKKMRRELKKSGADMADLSKPYREAAQTVGKAAKPATPKRSGALTRTVRASGTRTAGVVRAGSSTVPYANPVHWGWPSRGIVAQPWVSDAAQRTEPTWLQRFVAHMNEVLDQVKGAAR